MKRIAELYAYPANIDGVIDHFVASCQQAFGKDKLGILLVGSTSRGELSWSRKNDRLRFYSDIEFVVVVEKKIPYQQARFASLIEQYNKALDLGDRFKVDFVVNTWKGMCKVEKRIFAFDSKNTGIELGSVDVRPFLPDVSKATLNFHELNDVLLHRMKALLIDVPRGIFNKVGDLDDFRLSIAKNTLDITTWLYPYEADVLVSGFEARLNSWDNKKNALVLSEYFGDEEFGFLRDCLALRMSKINDYDISDMLRNYISIYDRAITYCKVMNGIDPSRDITELSVSRDLFWEYSSRRRLKEAYLMLRNYRLFSLKNLIWNVFLPRKGRQVDFCYSMLKSLSFNLRKKPEQFEAELEKSKIKLKVICSVKDDSICASSDSWFDIREQYKAINTVLI